MREYFNKKGLSYGRITILGILLLAFILIIIFGIYFSPYKNYQDNGNFINNSDGILIKQENGVKTYYLGKGQFKDVIPTVSAQASSPEGSYIDPPIYPELMGEIEGRFSIALLHHLHILLEIFGLAESVILVLNVAKKNTEGILFFL